MHSNDEKKGMAPKKTTTMTNTSSKDARIRNDDSKVPTRNVIHRHSRGADDDDDDVTAPPSVPSRSYGDNDDDKKVAAAAAGRPASSVPSRSYGDDDDDKMKKAAAAGPAFYPASSTIVRRTQPPTTASKFLVKTEEPSLITSADKKRPGVKQTPTVSMAASKVSDRYSEKATGDKRPELYPSMDTKRSACNLGAAIAAAKLSSGKHPTRTTTTATTTLRQPKENWKVASPTPALGIAAIASNESDLEAGLAMTSFHGEDGGAGGSGGGQDRPAKGDQGFSPVPPQPIQPGAVAVLGPNAANDNDNDSVADSTMIATMMDSTPPTVSSTEAPVSATLVDTEEERRKWQEELRNKAPIAEVVSDNPSPPKWRRWGIAGILVALSVVIIGVVAGLLARPDPEPAQESEPTQAPGPSQEELLETMLSSVSLDGGAALQNQSTPQYSALQWLYRSRYLHSYSDDTRIQRYVLATLYYSTNGSEWKNSYGWMTDQDECTWYNTADDSFCDATGSVVGLGLHFNNLVGTIPNELALLSDSVVRIDLQNNNLVGPIPSSLGLMTQLNYFDLYHDDLLGTIPTELGQITLMKELSLDYNALTGTIPTEIGQMTQLNYLDLSHNDLSGTIPTEIGQFTQLYSLLLSTNKMMGTIPTEIGQVTQLKLLYLHNNQMTGTIPTEIGQLTQLTSLSLRYTDLMSTIPTEIGELTLLRDLSLCKYCLTGTIPTEIGQLTNLSFLPFWGNMLTGTIPTEIGQLSQLDDLWLYNTMLTGTIPTEIGQLTDLNKLRLDNNTLTGTIPTEIGQLTQLKGLYLYNNSLTGTIPTEIGQLTKLNSLWLDNNQLTGDFTCPDYIRLCRISCNDGTSDACR